MSIFLQLRGGCSDRNTGNILYRRGSGFGHHRAEPTYRPPWIGCGLSISAAILLRPDGGLLLAAIGAYLLWQFLDGIRKRQAVGHLIAAAILVAIFAAAPLIPWTLRNLHAFHKFQPLAPRYANEANEFVPLGFNRWVKT